MAFSFYKMTKLFSEKSPQFSTLLIEQNFDAKHKVNLNENNFKIAIGAIGKYDEKIRHDPRYVTWIAFINNQTTGEKIQTQIKLHECTPQDFAEFYPIVKNQ